MSKFTITVFALLISQAILAADNQAQTSNQADQLAQTIPVIKQQIAETIQSVKAQEEQIMQKMLQLQQQNDQLKEKLNRLSQQVNPNADQNAAASTAQSGPACRLAPLQASTVTQNPSPPSSPVIPAAPIKPAPSSVVAQPHPSAALASPNGFSAYLNRIDWLKTGGLLVLIILLIGVGVLAALLFFRRPEKIVNSFQQELMPPKPIVASPEIETPSSLGFEEEYDFINSDEAIPLRLDLARAYLEMENYDEAKNALQTVLEKGTPEQKFEAKELMAVINSVV